MGVLLIPQAYSRSFYCFVKQFSWDRTKQRQTSFLPHFPHWKNAQASWPYHQGNVVASQSSHPLLPLLYLSSYTFQALFLIPVFVIPRFCGMSPVKFMWSLKAPSLTWLTVRWMYCLLSPVGDGHKQQHINNSLQRNRLAVPLRHMVQLLGFWPLGP